MSAIVSVIIPTFNRCQYLPSAIESVQQQTLSDWELIIVDDGSTDGTAEAVHGFLADRRIRFVPRDHRGRSAARNQGAELAQGEWLAFLDSDDRLTPGALAAHLDGLAGQPAGLLLGGYEYLDEQEHATGERRPWSESGLSVPEWLFNCLGMPGSVLIRRDWFTRVHGFDASLHMAEDWDLFLRLAQAGCPMGWTRGVVCRYRQHAGSSIHDRELHRQSALRVLDKFFQPAGLAPALATLAPRARAWVYVVFAQRAFAAGDAADGAQSLEHALALDPSLSGDRRAQVLECLFSPAPAGPQTEPDMTALVLAHLPAALQHPSGAIRQAQARAHMAQFFDAAGRGPSRQASAHLRAGVRQDARWLFNRGVLAYCARQALSWRPAGRARRQSP